MHRSSVAAPRDRETRNQIGTERSCTHNWGLEKVIRRIRVPSLLWLHLRIISKKTIINLKLIAIIIINIKRKLTSLALGLRYVFLDEESFATVFSRFEIGCSAVALDGGKDLDAKAMSMVGTEELRS
jgi:hypothetical protein